MDQREACNKSIAMADISLGILSIAYETVAVVLGGIRRVVRVGAAGHNDPGDVYSHSVSADQVDDNAGTTSYDSPKLASFLTILTIIYGLYLAQVWFAAQLFMGSKLLQKDTSSALQKLSCWRIWSLVFLMLLLSILLLTGFSDIQDSTWKKYLLFGFLSVHIVFRILSLFYVGKTRKMLKGTIRPHSVVVPPFRRYSMVHNAVAGVPHSLKMISV